MFRYNTLVPMAGAALLGVTAGVTGTFMLLRKRALVGDVVGHAALPGVGIAFFVMETMQRGSGKNMPGLLLGAALTGLAGVGCVLAIRKLTRIKEDAALAIVLGIFFGAGLALLSVIQRVSTGSQAGLDHYIFGMASALVLNDVLWILAVTLAVLLISGLLFKELALLCFDEDFAATQGWPVMWLDIVLTGLVLCVAVVGMKSVGLLLVVALLVIPAAAARFWTDQLSVMLIIAGALGGLSAIPAVLASHVYARLPTGPMIVLVCAVFFLASLLFGPRRGVLQRWLVHRRLQRRVGRHDLLRAMYEFLEDNEALSGDPPLPSVPLHGLLALRSWTPARLRRLLAAARRDGLVQFASGDNFQLTRHGLTEARRVIRNHRLWELYLISYADIAPSHVDRDADLIEHVLDAEIIEELETKLSTELARAEMPASPHVLGKPG
jgi:manganese/zinc/iron transport system permease protein